MPITQFFQDAQSHWEKKILYTNNSRINIKKNEENEGRNEGGRREGTSILKMILFWPLGKIFYTK